MEFQLATLEMEIGMLDVFHTHIFTLSWADPGARMHELEILQIFQILSYLSPCLCISGSLPV